MSNKYYYLAASLPYLKFDSAPAVSAQDFISDCSKWLTAGDLEALLSVSLKDPTAKISGLDIVKEWKAFDLSIREELAKIRKAKKDRVKEKISPALATVFSNEIPLEMEKRLEKIRWDFLENKEISFYFDLNALIIYYLKLQILERLKTFDKEKGKTKFEKLCEVTYG